jgi:small neutral amino acid transporter SnatA (MarC family)
MSSLVVSDTFTDDLIKSVVSLFVVVNPIGKVPLFITLTQKMDIACSDRSPICSRRCQTVICATIRII